MGVIFPEITLLLEINSKINRKIKKYLSKKNIFIILGKKIAV